MKFEDIMEGKVENPTAEQVQEALKESVSSCENLKELNDFLVKLHASDAYKVIRDIVLPKTNFLVVRERQQKSEEYQRFQDIQLQAKKVFDYECKTATMFEVHQVSEQTSQKYYGITVRMISMLDDELGKIEQAVNIIQEHLGLDVTKFEKETNDDTTESGNEQRSEEVTE